MDRFSKTAWTSLLTVSLLQAGLILLPSTAVEAQQETTIRSVKVLSQGSNFELEIDANRPVMPNTQVITGPDRLVIDFPHAVPGRSLRPLTLKTAQVKGVRMGLFASTPPVARVVLDLTGPQSYEIFPSGDKVIVKLASSSAGNKSMPMASPAPSAATQPTVPEPGMVQAAAAPAAPPPPPQPHAEVTLDNGRLIISSDRDTLADILHQVQRRTGASLYLPPGGGQEAVVTQLGPAPVRDVLSKLLNGSAYNVVLVGNGHDWSSVTSIILTPKGSEGEDMPANFSARAVEQPAVEAQPPQPDTAQSDPPPPPPPDPQAETQQAPPTDAPGPSPDAIPPPPQ